MADVPYGVLLSGGLDSSIISAIAKKFAAMRIESGNTEAAWWPQLHSFAVGLVGSPDLAAARKVAVAIACPSPFLQNKRSRTHNFSVRDLRVIF
jgi:asparagine synthetase B (glutamine-hydrolysing)